LAYICDEKKHLASFFSSPKRICYFYAFVSLKRLAMKKF